MKAAAGGPLFKEEIHDRFHLELGRLIHASAQLDFAVGLALDWLGPHNGKPVARLLQGRRPLVLRIDELEPLIKLTFQSGGEQVLREFSDWFAQAKALKDMRNDYAHARWHVPDYSVSDDPEVVLVPLNWEWDPAHQPEETRMRLSELAERAKAVSDCTRRLSALIKTHLPFAAAAKSPSVPL